ncbi:hypothetical protein [Agreia sp. VKM Ac-1783]|nr:hypothetical protein [Agreia sp. VKM Ac-1783]SMQ68474.1 hypothetical protein SAMN06295943_1879 [Agreia sp. VKM Ac-1783]
MRRLSDLVAAGDATLAERTWGRAHRNDEIVGAAHDEIARLQAG